MEASQHTSSQNTNHFEITFTDIWEKYLIHKHKPPLNLTNTERVIMILRKNILIEETWGTSFSPHTLWNISAGLQFSYMWTYTHCNRNPPTASAPGMCFVWRPFWWFIRSEEDGLQELQLFHLGWLPCWSQGSRAAQTGCNSYCISLFPWTQLQLW